MEINVNIKISAEELVVLEKAMREERRDNDQRIREQRKHQAEYTTQAKKKYNELRMMEKKIADLKKDL